MKNQLTILTQEEKDAIIESIANKAQSILDNDGAITVKLFNESLELESDSCISICGEDSELEINLQDTEMRIPSYQYINSEDLDSYNPILHFKDLSVEFDMVDWEDC